MHQGAQHEDVSARGQGVHQVLLQHHSEGAWGGPRGQAGGPLQQLALLVVGLWASLASLKLGASAPAGGCCLGCPPKATPTATLTCCCCCLLTPPLSLRSLALPILPAILLLLPGYSYVQDVVEKSLPFVKVAYSPDLIVLLAVGTVLLGCLFGGLGSLIGLQRHLQEV